MIGSRAGICEWLGFEVREMLEIDRPNVDLIKDIYFTTSRKYDGICIVGLSQTEALRQAAHSRWR